MEKDSLELMSRYRKLPTDELVRIYLESGLSVPARRLLVNELLVRKVDVEALDQRAARPSPKKKRAVVVGGLLFTVLSLLSLLMGLLKRIQE